MELGGIADADLYGDLKEEDAHEIAYSEVRETKKSNIRL